MSEYSSLVVNDMHFFRIIALRSPSLRAIIPTLFSFLKNQNKSINQNLFTLHLRKSHIHHPYIGTGFGNHEHAKHWNCIGKQYNRNVKTKA